MLEVAVLLVSIAAVIVSVLVPFLSVSKAQKLASHDARRQSARDAFLRVSRHIQDYRIAFLDHYGNRRTIPSHSMNEVPEWKRILRESAAKLREMVTILNEDCLYLGLIFDKQADPLGSRVQQLAGKADLLFSDSGPPTFEKCQEGLNEDIQAISQLIKPLWDSLK